MSKVAAKKKILKITRTFDAPLQKVWDAWTKPEYYKKWWGPKDFTCPYSEIDFRVGGKYLHCMKANDGKEYWSTGIYKEIDPMEKIVCTDSFADEKGNAVPASYYGMGDDFPMELKVLVTLKELEGKTQMNMEHVGFPQGDMIEQAKIGWNESFDKLAKSLK